MCLMCVTCLLTEDVTHALVVSVEMMPNKEVDGRLTQDQRERAQEGRPVDIGVVGILVLVDDPLVSGPTVAESRHRSTRGRGIQVGHGKHPTVKSGSVQ